MDPVQTPTVKLMSPVARAGLFAAAGAALGFLWLALTLVFGAAGAHADTGSPGHDGPHGGLGSAVSHVAGELTKTVSATTHSVAKTATATIARTVTGATGAVAHAPVVAPVTTPVLHTAQKVAAAVTTPVATVVRKGVVAPVVAPVVTAVTGIPVVGSIVESTGLDAALTGIGSSVDQTLGTVVAGTAQAATAPPATGPTSGIPGSPGNGTAGSASDGTGVPAAPASLSPPDPADAVAAFFAAARGGADLALRVAGAITATIAPGLPSAPASDPLFGACAPTATCSLGSSGAGAGAGAFLALTFVVGYRAWTRRRGVPGDQAPPAPFFATDVSPD